MARGGWGQPIAIARGESGGHIEKYGAATDLDNGVVTDLWDGRLVATGFSEHPFASFDGGVSVEVVAGVNDTAAGTGTRAIFVEGLDDSFLHQTTTVVPNGASAVALSGTWTRIFRAYQTDAGTGEVNDGLIEFRESGDGDCIAIIPAGEGQTQQAIYTVPANKTAYLTKWSASMAGKSTASVLFKLWQRYPMADRPYRHLKRRVQLATTGMTAFAYEYTTPLIIPGGTDIWWQAESNVNNTGGSGSFELYLE